LRTGGCVGGVARAAKWAVDICPFPGFGNDGFIFDEFLLSRLFKLHIFGLRCTTTGTNLICSLVSAAAIRAFPF
jgi:hypothetical protein